MIPVSSQQYADGGLLLEWPDGSSDHDGDPVRLDEADGAVDGE